MLCNCLPFAISGRCEYEQAALSMLSPEEASNLCVPGAARPGGRPSKLPQLAGGPAAPRQAQSNTDVMRPGVDNLQLSDARAKSIPKAAAADVECEEAGGAEASHGDLWGLLVHLGMQQWFEQLVIRHKLDVKTIASLGPGDLSIACGMAVASAWSLLQPIGLRKQLRAPALRAAVVLRGHDPARRQHRLVGAAAVDPPALRGRSLTQRLVAAGCSMGNWTPACGF